MKKAEWILSFVKHGPYDWDYYINEIYQGQAKTQLDCLDEIEMIAKGLRPLETVNKKPKRPLKSPKGRGKGKKKSENLKAK